MKKVRIAWSRVLFWTLIGLFLFGIFWFSYNTGDRLYKKYDRYCAPINELIKDVEFFSGGIGEKQIVLCDQNYDVIKVIPFNGYQKSFHIRQMFRDGVDGVVFFEMGRAVDDSYGIVYINDSQKNKLLDGFDLMDQTGYHKIGTPKRERHGIYNGPHKWMPDVTYLKRLGPNVYSYSTMTPR